MWRMTFSLSSESGNGGGIIHPGGGEKSSMGGGIIHPGEEESSIHGGEKSSMGGREEKSSIGGGGRNHPWGRVGREEKSSIRGGEIIHPGRWERGGVGGGRGGVSSAQARLRQPAPAVAGETREGG